MKKESGTQKDLKLINYKYKLILTLFWKICLVTFFIIICTKITIFTSNYKLDIILNLTNLTPYFDQAN